jgi:hypothetical protein
MQATSNSMTDGNNDLAARAESLYGRHGSNAQPQSRTTEEKIAGAFAEVYRGIYPHMSEKTRDRIKRFILADPTEYTPENPRAAKARALAISIVDKHYQGIGNGVLLKREDYIGDVAEKEMAPDRKRISEALRPEGLIDSKKEAYFLAKQLQAIPPISSLIKDQKALITGYNRWVNTAAQVHLKGAAR